MTDRAGGNLRPFPVRIFVDQQAVSRNAGREEQDPVFIIEDNGVQRLAHRILIRGQATLCYDKTRQPRAWLEASDIEES